MSWLLVHLFGWGGVGLVGGGWLFVWIVDYFLFVCCCLAVSFFFIPTMKLNVLHHAIIKDNKCMAD